MTDMTDEERDYIRQLFGTKRSVPEDPDPLRNLTRRLFQRATDTDRSDKA